MISYLILALSSLIIAKICLWIINLFHKPREGVFLRSPEDKDYYYWSLRSLIKKFPIWTTRLLPLNLLNSLLYKWFGVQTDYSNNLHGAIISSEFVEFGKNISIGKGCYIKSSYIFDKYLIIKRIVIEDNVTIGPQCYIFPGTHILKDASLNAHSITHYNQVLEAHGVYSGSPAQKVEQDIPYHQITKSALKKNLFSLQNEEDPLKDPYTPFFPESRFVKKLPTHLSIFFFLYIFSYGPPMVLLFLVISEYFYPLIVNSSSLDVLLLPKNLIGLLISPFVLISLYLLNIFLLILLTKIIYQFLESQCPFREGEYDWNRKNKEYRFYFIRSFLMRYLKWKILKGPFPWLIKPAFNFIGNCAIGKNTILEDLYIAKEHLEIGHNVYLGNIIVANHYWDKSLSVKGIKIQDKVVVSDGCCIGPGTEIGEKTSILPLSITTKSDILRPNSYYFDIPIQEISKEDLRKKYNFKEIFEGEEGG